MKRLLLLAAAALAGCSVSLDPGSVPCRNDGECPTGAFCAASGKCAPQPACSGGTSSCHGACVNLSTSAANCGTCGNSCTAPAGATATCSSGSCGFTCTPPAVQQGTGCLTPPAMPTDLTATATSSVTLDWAAQADAISYEVFKATDAGGPFDSIASPTTNTYEDQAVSPGTTYFYEIKAHNLAGASAATSPVSVLTQPATPTNFGASLITGNSAVALTWDRMPGAASYDVYRGRSSGSQALYHNVADPGSGSTVKYDDPAPLSGVSAFYSVQARNGSGASAPSTTAQALTAPAAPQTVTATPNSDGSVTIAWSSSTGATSYAVFRGGTNVSGPLGSSASSYVDTPGFGGTFTYDVAASNASGTGPHSGQQTALTRPDVPQHVSASLDATKTAITVSWDRMPGAASYDVWKSTSAGGEAFVATVNDPAASYPDPAPDSGLTDYYKVLAHNASGDSPLSLEASATTVPLAPGSVGAVANADGSVTVSWTPPPNAALVTGYYVYRGGVQEAGPLTASPHVETPPAGGTFQYAVAAANSTGIGALGSAPSTVLTPPPAVTLSVDSLSASAGVTSIGLSWTSATGAASYDLYRDGTKIDSADPGTTYSDVEHSTGTQHTFKVIATNATGPSPDSNSLTVTTVAPDPTGLTVKAVTTGSVSLTWNRSTTATTYSVKRGPAGSETFIQTVNDPGDPATIVSYVDNGLPPSTQYSYVVSALNNGGALESGNSANVTPTTLTPTPVGLAVAQQDDTHLSLSWTRVTAGVDSYDVLRGTASGAESPTPVANVPNPSSGATVQYSDPNLASNTMYFYQVVGREASLKSAASAEASARTMLSPPTNLAATALDYQTIQLTWTKPTGGPYTYVLMYGLTAGQEFAATTNQIPDDGNPTTQTLIDGDFSYDGPLAPGTTYFFRVIATNGAAGNTSLPSEEASTTTLTSGPPLNVTPIDATHVSLDASRFTGYDTFEFYKSQNNTQPDETTAPNGPGPIIQLDGSDVILTDTLTTSGTWFYSVRARFGAGLPTPWTPLVGVTTAPGTPSTPNNLNVISGNGEALLSWDAMVNASTYNVLRATVPTGPYTTVASPATPYYADISSSSAPDPQNGKTYYYEVQSVGAGGLTSAATGPFSTTVDPTAFTVLQTLVSYTAGGADTQPELVFGKIVPPTGPAIGINCINDGHCLARGVPSGPVYVKRGLNYVLTSGRSIDVSVDQYGRADQHQYMNYTPVSFTMSNLAPWTAQSALQITASNLTIGGGDDLEASFIVHGPQPGDTSLDDFQVDGESWAGAIDTAKGDVAWLLQRSLFTSSTGLPYQTVARAASGFAMSQVDGRLLTVAPAAFVNVTPSTAKFKYLRSQFKALAPLINPAAIVDGFPDLATFEAVPYDSNGITHPFAGGASVTLALLLLDNGATDVDYGTLDVGNPMPSSGPGGFSTLATIEAGFNVPVDCKGCKNGGGDLLPAIAGGSVSTIDSLSTVLSEASAGGVMPHLHPVQAPQINGKDLFTDQTAVTTAPIISWTAPDLGAPTYYRLFLYQIGDDGSGSGVASIFNFGNPLAQLYTTGTSLQVPPGLLQSNCGAAQNLPCTYFFDIRPVFEDRDIINRPFIRGDHEYFVDTITNSFSP